MNPIYGDRALRLCGYAGLLAAVFWMIGDAGLLGARANLADYPPLQDYLARISFEGLDYMLPNSEPRLAFGALVAVLAMPLYLLGAWHWFLVAHGRGWMAWTLFALLVCGNAYSPLGHAAFYHLGMVYKTLLLVPADAHPALLALGEQFHRLLMIAWVAAVGGLVAGLGVLTLAIACGRTRLPRSSALLLNPLSLGVLGHFAPAVLAEPLGTWLRGAGINIGWFLAYAFSSLWFARRGAQSR